MGVRGGGRGCVGAGGWEGGVLGVSGGGRGWVGGLLRLRGSWGCVGRVHGWWEGCGAPSLLTSLAASLHSPPCPLQPLPPLALSHLTMHSPSPKLPTHSLVAGSPGDRGTSRLSRDTHPVPPPDLCRPPRPRVHPPAPYQLPPSPHHSPDVDVLVVVDSEGGLSWWDNKTFQQVSSTLTHTHPHPLIPAPPYPQNLHMVPSVRPCFHSDCIRQRTTHPNERLPTKFFFLRK